MAITVETGLIVAGAESYVTVTEADTYHGNRNNTGWTGTDAVKEAALRRAAAYLDGHYRRRWKGLRVNPLVQALEWPRVGCVIVEDSGSSGSAFFDGPVIAGGQLCIPSSTIPQRLKDAQCELALRALAGDLAVDGENNITRKKVDVLETEFMAGTVRGQKQYQIVDQLLSDLVRPVGSGTALRG